MNHTRNQLQIEPLAANDAKYLPAATEYLIFCDSGPSAFVLVAPSQHKGYFYVTACLPDCQGVAGLEGLKRPLLAGHAARIARKYAETLRGADEGVRFADDSGADFGPLPWTYNRLLYNDWQNWIDCGLLATREGGR